MDGWFDFASQFDWRPSWWSVLGAVTYALALLSIPSVLLQRRGSPQAAVSWILVLFSLPFLGLLLWWAFGRQHLVRKRRRRLRAADKMTRSLSELREALPSSPEARWDMLSFRRLPPEDAEWVFPPTAGNRVRLLIDGEQAYPAMEDAIVSAEHHVHLLFYIWNDDGTGRRYRDLLVDRAQAGVQVRVLCDAYGSPAARRELMRPLNEAGGQVAVFLPPRIFARRPHLNFRNHRKLVVVDGATGFVGGLNIGDEYNKWRDTALCVHGPAVDQLQEVFVDDWFFAHQEDISTPEYFGRWRTEDCKLSGTLDDDALCAVVASGPHTENNITHDALFTAITRADHRVWITTPYLIPSPSIMAALRTAVYRGVDVRVMLPARGDSRIVQWAWRSYYPSLLGAGVRIFEYLPGFLHAKSALFDDDLSVVGSANIDIRSFKLNFEVSCAVRSHALCNALARQFEVDMSRARRVALAEVEGRSTAAKLAEAVAHLFSPLM